MQDNQNNIFEQLEEVGRIGSKSNQKIAEYLIAYPGNYENLKIAEIAKNCYVSNATVARFAKKLGYLGFPEFKIQLIYQKKNYEGNENIEFNNKTIDVHLFNIISSFEKTTQLINERELKKLINLLENVKQTNIFALGETNIVAQDFQLKLVRIGKNATAFSDIHTQHFCACNSTEETLAIGITYSASTKEILKNLETSKKYGATTVLISSVKTKVPDFVDIVIRVEASESIARVFSTTSRFAILYMLDIIYHKIIENKPEYYKKKLVETRLKK